MRSRSAAFLTHHGENDDKDGFTVLRVAFAACPRLDAGRRRLSGAMGRFDRGDRRKSGSSAQDSNARRSNWKSGGKSGGKGGGRHKHGSGSRAAASASATASITEKSAATHLKERTGRSLEEWVQLVQETGPATRKERSEWLKTKHGLGTNFAAWIALSADATNGENGANGSHGANGRNGNGAAAGDAPCEDDAAVGDDASVEDAASGEID